MYEDFNVLTERELESRVEIKYDAYTNTKLIEYKVAMNLARREIMPAIVLQITDLGTAFLKLRLLMLHQQVFKVI